MRLVAAVVAGVAAGSATPTYARAADPGSTVIADLQHRFALTVPTSWARSESAEPVIVAMNEVGSGARLRVVRTNYPNGPAWRDQIGFFEEVERGLKEAAPGYRRVARKQHRVSDVPVMDITFRRRSAAGEQQVVAARFLFFRRYSLTLIVAASPRGFRRAKLTGIRDRFVPYLQPQARSSQLPNDATVHVASALMRASAAGEILSSRPRSWPKELPRQQ